MMIDDIVDNDYDIIKEIMRAENQVSNKEDILFSKI